MIGEGIRAKLSLFNTMNNWIGKPADYSIGPVQLLTENEILALSAGFDVSRANHQPARLFVNIILIVMSTVLQTDKSSNRK